MPYQDRICNLLYSCLAGKDLPPWKGWFIGSPIWLLTRVNLWNLDFLLYSKIGMFCRSYPCYLFPSLQQAKYMVDLEIQVPTPFDPFAEARESDAPGAKEYVHIRIQQRNGKKSLTTVQGLKKEFSYEKILKDLKKDFCCNGTVVQDKELGKIIQLQGDQRKNVSHFLIHARLARKDQIKIHGFWPIGLVFVSSNFKLFLSLWVLKVWIVFLFDEWCCNKFGLVWFGLVFQFLMIGFHGCC